MSHFLHALSFAALALLCTPVAQASDPEADRQLAEAIEQRTNRSDQGLPPVSLANGGVMLDLKDRFQNVMLSKLDRDGSPVIGCVASLTEANQFFGRDLKTSVPLISPILSKQQTLAESQAALHGMSNAEFNYYTGLIAASKELSPDAQAFQIVNADGAGEGFNSTVVRAPEGGNTGTTLGQQRLNVFQRAGQIWGGFLDGNVQIQVRANFDPLLCQANSAVLGAAGSSSIFRDFPGALNSNTFYHAALANKLAGTDQNSGEEIGATFSSNIDTGCFSGITRFYYGFDNATPAGSINLLVVLLHELGHGLGSSSFVDGATGVFAGGFPDVWSRLMWDRSNGLTWFAMNNSQRIASARNTGNLYWDGANVKQASKSLTAGTDASGRVLLYAPNPLEPGSSVSHFDLLATPNLLMEPFISVGLPLTLDLTRQQMRDIGWYRDSTADRVPDTITNVTPNSGSVVVGNNVNITWSNTGGFNRNVTIELSSNGGSTFPILIASDVANTGTRSWVVSNNLTSQARIRVREHDFLAPVGSSSANFTITNISNSAPTFSPVASIIRQRGSPAGAAVTLGTVSDTQTPAANLTVTQIAGGTATGITVGTLSNSNGTISAPISASCTANGGTVRFQVSDGTLLGTGDLTMQVDVNSVPTLNYLNPSVNGGAGGTLSPSAGPSDNGSISTIALQSAGTYTGTLSVNNTTGVVNFGNAAPIGVHTIIVRATDNCAAIRDASFQLTVNNTAPTFAPAATITRQRGSAAGAAVSIGTASDAQSAASSLVVTQVVGGNASGISIGTISNSNGVISATVAASCTALGGSVRFQVSDGGLANVGDLQVAVNANTTPVLSYPAQSLDGGSGLQVSPNGGPSDNGSVSSIVVQSVGGYTGGVSVADTTGVVTLSNAAPLGQHTLTLRITDNCGASTDALLQLVVNNTAPSLVVSAAPASQQGSPAGAAVGVGTVSDGQSAAGSLQVTAIAGGTASGISVGTITNNAGVISAPLSANCTAASGTQRFRVSDGGLNSTADLQIDVLPNSAPSLLYGNQQVALDGTLSVNPSAAPGDNGNISGFSVLSAGTYTGTLSVDATGLVSLSAAAPAGVHTLTIRATDNCAANSDRSFTLQVIQGLLFRNGFE